jgi:hypothetical protein
MHRAGFDKVTDPIENMLGHVLLKIGSSVGTQGGNQAGFGSPWLWIPGE